MLLMLLPLALPFFSGSFLRASEPGAPFGQRGITSCPAAAKATERLWEIRDIVDVLEAWENTI